jgi:hypothetical protein
MSIGEIQSAVESLLRTQIPAPSVREALSAHARDRDSRFRRVGHGFYERRSV